MTFLLFHGAFGRRCERSEYGGAVHDTLVDVETGMKGHEQPKFKNHPIDVSCEESSKRISFCIRPSRRNQYTNSTDTRLISLPPSNATAAAVLGTI